MTTEQQAIELAIAELNPDQLSRDVDMMFNAMHPGWQKKTVGDLRMMMIKQKELIKLLKGKSSILGDVKTEQSKFYPISTSAKPKR